MTSMAEQLAKVGLVSKEEVERIKRSQSKQLRDQEEQERRRLEYGMEDVKSFRRGRDEKY